MLKPFAALALALALQGCSKVHLPFSLTEDPVPRAYKYRFGDWVQFHSHFYGDCEAKVENVPYFSYRCRLLDGALGNDYVYFFGDIFCGDEEVLLGERALMRCERELERAKPRDKVRKAGRRSR